MSSENTTNINNPLQIKLKWGKQTFDLTLVEEHERTAAALQQAVESLTGVPAPRQKLLAKKAWKGPLKADDTSSLATVTTCPLAVTLIGSAETLATPAVKTTFVEDLSPQEVRAAQEAEAQAAWKTAMGMIPALQLLPQYRDDGKQETYVYNRLVTGLPQRQVEHELQNQTNDNRHRLQGKVAMQLGLELRRAYVNDVAVLPNGTCVSVLDDGHVQCWKHAAQQDDLIHPGHDGPADSVTAVGNGNMFATAGRGSVQLWTTTDDDDVKPVLTLPSAMPGTSPTHVVSVNKNSSSSSSLNNQQLPITCLAARLQVTRATNPNQFHLPPQNEAQRQRRVQAEAQERAVQHSLSRAARSIQVWAPSSNGNTAVATPGGGLQLQSRLLEPPIGGLEGSAPVTCLVQMQQDPSDDVSLPEPFLIAGDAAGGLRIWRISSPANSNNQGLQIVHHGLYQLVTDVDTGCSIVCLQVLPNGRLAVSTDTARNVVPLAGAQSLAVSSPRAVHILDLSSLLLLDGGSAAVMPIVQSSLTGHSHKDAVICMCALPNGDLLTGGGKMDATLQLWSSEQQQGTPELSSSPPQHDTPCQTWSEVGYVFALAVLFDVKENSNFYAVAAARYNTVKVIV